MVASAFTCWIAAIVLGVYPHPGGDDGPIQGASPRVGDPVL